MRTTKYGLWESARAKNPLVKRNASVSAFGENYRVAGLVSGGVKLRREVLVSVRDVKAPVNARKSIDALEVIASGSCRDWLRKQGVDTAHIGEADLPAAVARFVLAKGGA